MLTYGEQPTGCNLTRFDPEGFSRLVGNRTIAVIGDSLGSHLASSLVCLANSGASKLVPWQDTWARLRITGLQHPKYGTRYTTLFSNYLVDMPKRNEPNLSKVDPRYSRWIDHVDIVLFQATHWYLQGANSKYTVDGQVRTNLSDAQAYGLGMATVASFLAARKWAGIAVLLSHSPSHYTLMPDVPIKKGSLCETNAPLSPKQTLVASREAAGGSVLRQARVTTAAWTTNRDGARSLIYMQRRIAARFPIFRFADITPMTYLRADSHIQGWNSPKGVPPRGGRDDCTHFCEAGVTDEWVEVVYNLLLTEPSLRQPLPNSESKSAH
eukprot:jgi/Mesen1/7494/ME000039S06706